MLRGLLYLLLSNLSLLLALIWLSQVYGNGYDLAIGTWSYPDLPDAVRVYHPHVDIGSIPTEWNLNPNSYEKYDILKLVIFYNKNFGICTDDSLSIRRDKIHVWLAGQAWFGV